MIRIITWAFVIDMIIMPLLFLKLFFSPIVTPIAIANTVDQNTVLGPATTLFVQQLKNDGYTPIVLGEISRSSFSVSGRIITLNNDNIQAFEYADHDSALHDASILADKYTSSSRPIAWKKNMHLYVNDKLVTFYMGNNAYILNSLDQNAGLSLLETATSSSALTSIMR